MVSEGASARGPARSTRLPAPPAKTTTNSPQAGRSEPSCLSDEQWDFLGARVSFGLAAGLISRQQSGQQQAPEQNDSGMPPGPAQPACKILTWRLSLIGFPHRLSCPFYRCLHSFLSADE